MLDLSKGIFLEDRNILIRWGATRKQLWSLGNPVEYYKDDVSRVLWKNIIVLNGIKADMLVWLPEENDTLNNVSIYAAESESSGIWDKKWLVMMAEHLNKLIGKPFDYDDRIKNINEDIGIPMFTWKTGKITVSQTCDIRFTEGFWLDIYVDKNG